MTSPTPPRQLAQLGLRREDLRAFERKLVDHRGLILCTGPQASGLRTSCYAALQFYDADRLSIATIEARPPSYIPGIHQSVTDPKIGLDLGALLQVQARADVDVLYVHALIDTRSAELSLDLAMRGAVVLSTLHTTSAAHAPGRLAELGLAPERIAKGLTAVLAQRLLPHAKDPQKQIPIFELLCVQNELQTLIEQGAPAEALHRAAVDKGMEDLQACARRKVQAGWLRPEDAALLGEST